MTKNISGITCTTFVCKLNYTPQEMKSSTKTNKYSHALVSLDMGIKRPRQSFMYQYDHPYLIGVLSPCKLGIEANFKAIFIFNQALLWELTGGGYSLNEKWDDLIEHQHLILLS